MDMPPEMMLAIFQKLAPRDLKEAVLVCHSWKVFAENSPLWAWCIICIDNPKDLCKVETKRAEKIESIWLEFMNPEELNGVLKTLLKKLPNLKIIMGLEFQELSCIEPNILAKVVNKVESVEWCFNTTITSEQAQTLLFNMGQETNLKEMKMLNRNLQDIEPETLGLALNNLQNLRIANVPDVKTLTPEQVNGVFLVMSEGTKLKEVCLRDLNISQVEPMILASAARRLEELVIWRTFSTENESELSDLQTKTLFNTLSKKTELKRLIILAKNMINVDPRVLARALNNLEEVHLFDNMITDLQSRTLLDMMSENTFLQNLTIINNGLETVQPNLLGGSLSQMKELILVNCRLTPEQTNSLFSSMKEKCKMTSLDISNNNLSSVNPEVLASAVITLTNITMHNNHLTFGQVLSIFTQCAAKETRLKNLSIGNSKLTELDKELVAVALNNLEEVNLDECDMTGNQINSTLKLCMEKESKLMNLSFENQDLTGVDKELLRQSSKKFSLLIEI